MATIKHGSMLVPVSELEEVFDEAAMRMMARNEFYHMRDALSYYRGLGAVAPFDEEDQARIFCEIVDTLRDRWGGRPTDYLGEILSLVPDYGLLGQEPRG